MTTQALFWGYASGNVQGFEPAGGCADADDGSETCLDDAMDSRLADGRGLFLRCDGEGLFFHARLVICAHDDSFVRW